MGTPNIGHQGAFVGMAVESTWGTAVSPRTNFLRAKRLAMRRTIETAVRGAMGSVGTTDLNARKLYQTRNVAGGTIAIECGYSDSTALLLRDWIGACATAGAGPYTHTMTPTVPASLPVGLTIEQGFGRRGSTNDAEVFEGCVVNGGTFRCAPGEVAELELDIIAETSGGRVAASTPTYTSNDYPILHSHAGVLAWGSLSDRVLSLEISVQQSLARRFLLGSNDTARPYPSGLLEITVRVTREYDENTVYEDYLDRSEADLTITFSDSPRSLAFTVHNAQCTDFSDSIQAGVTTQQIVWRGLSDGTDEGISAVLTNANSAVTAN
jgi:hypothetical protein